MARSYPLIELPQLVKDLEYQLLKTRDFTKYVPEYPDLTTKTIGIITDAIGTELFAIRDEWFVRAKQTIRSIRGVRNDIPVWQVEEIEEPEPDPIDYYYYDPGSFSRIKDPNPQPEGEPPGWDPYKKTGETGESGIKLLSPVVKLLNPVVRKLKPIGPIIPRPPWPPWPPLPPPPPIINWRPPAEEAYTYAYAYFYFTEFYAGLPEGVPMRLAFDYVGFFLAEFLKNFYMVDRFRYLERDALEFLEPYLPRLTDLLK